MKILRNQSNNIIELPYAFIEHEEFKTWSKQQIYIEIIKVLQINYSVQQTT